ncbi:MAG: hypothetical protein EOO45_16210 [Flavobacterium sp.]|nr:MAG: hypothetical protein EOO45_16210 [Flavobacterium sp.]
MRRSISYETVHEYVLENNLTDNDTIVLHPHDFDVVATEYIIENNLIMYRPVEVLGTKVQEDTTGEVRRNNIFVMQLAAS